jgi:ABC-type dipeptide/oligopeptide/nickel transport system permease component
MLGNSTSVSQRVTNAVVLVGWLWVYSLLFAVPVGIYVVLFNVYQTETVPDLSAMAGAVNPGFLLLGAAVALAGFVLILSNSTFGRQNVDAAIDQSQEIQEVADAAGDAE